jgi:hypothetical protein
LAQICFSSYTQEHIYQALDSKAPFNSQYTAGEKLKSEILIILDIGHSKGVLCQNNESYFSSGNWKVIHEVSSGFHGNGVKWETRGTFWWIQITEITSHRWLNRGITINLCKSKREKNVANISSNTFMDLLAWLYKEGNL